MFGVSLRGLVSTYFGPRAKQGELLRVVQGAWREGLDGGQVTSAVAYPCRAYKVGFDSTLIDGTNIRHEDCRIRVYADTLPVDVIPTSADRFLLGGVEYEILHVGGDPAEAVHVLHARGPGGS